MPFCESCGVEIGYLPFKCKYCGGIFCKKHRLPENHDCTFELKHTPVVPIPTRNLSRTISTSSQKSSTKPPRKIKKYIKRQEKQKIKTIRDFEDYGAREAKGTKYLIALIFILSLVTFIYPLFLTLSSLSFLNLWLWSLITSFFVSYTQDLFGLFFLIILIILFYVMIKNLERTFGTKFLVRLYFLCGFMTALFYLLLLVALQPFYSYIIVVPIGLASGALLGVICFMIFLNINREMTFLVFFMPIRMKGRTIIIFLVLLNLIPGLLLAIGDLLYLLVYLPDLGGIFGSYLLYYFKYKTR
jgi:membrane associated rhomboid family serine protease